MIKSLFSLVLITVLCSPDLNNQTKGLDSFFGQWEGTGSLFGAPATFKMSWNSIVDGKFIELNFQNKFAANGQEQKLTARAVYWFTDDEQLEGNWYDSRRMILPLKATFKKNTLTTLWGDDSTEQGKTVYQLKNNGTIEVEDFVLRSGNMSLFGQAKYRQVDE